MKKILCFILRDEDPVNIEIVYRDDREAQLQLDSLDEKSLIYAAQGTMVVAKILNDHTYDFYKPTQDMLFCLSNKSQEDFIEYLADQLSKIVDTLMGEDKPLPLRKLLVDQLSQASTNLLLRNIIEKTDFNLSETTVPLVEIEEPDYGLIEETLADRNYKGKYTIVPIVRRGLFLGHGVRFDDEIEEQETH